MKSEWRQTRGRAWDPIDLRNHVSEHAGRVGAAAAGGHVDLKPVGGRAIW